MNSKKIVGVLAIVGFIYLVIQALPFLIAATANILYLGFSLIMLIVVILGGYHFLKWCFGGEINK